jgi:hypothetical protein
MTWVEPQQMELVGHRYRSHCRPGAGAGSRSGTQVPEPMWDRGTGLSQFARGTYAEHGASKRPFRTFVRLIKPGLTRDFTTWAVTGSNRRPLRCKGGSVQFDHQRKRVSLQFRATFRVVSLRPS